MLLLFLIVLLAPAPAEEPAVAPHAEALLTRINQVRVQHGLSPVKLDRSLMWAATINSDDMVEGNYFGHVSPVAGHGRPSDRANKAGYKWNRLYENIYRTRSEDPQVFAQQAMETWMASQIHRENLMATEADDIGIGIARYVGGEIVVTVVLGRD